tara:strand:- start:3689 stop:4333 length:645 start_codon:yes stop_codon:yes gene_type:complete
MALTTSYLVTTRNVEPFFNSLISARAPEVFTQKFLESLEFKSTNDRLYIGLLKSLGFLEESGAPTTRYYEFMDQGQSKKVMAQAVMDAYEDLFNVYTEANNLTVDEVKNKLKTLTQGKHSDKVYGLMANTFKALVDYANWDSKEGKSKNTSKKEQEPQKIASPTLPVAEVGDPKSNEKSLSGLGLHYNIQIHLPESRDPAVYDALFKSLKDHLL